MKILRKAALGGLFAFAATTAHASLIDFTTPTTFTTLSNVSASGVIDGVTYTITPNPVGELTFSEAGTGTTCLGNGLACEFDGLGVSDDEISFRPPQSITVTFDQEVTLTELYFLDLFISADHSSSEQANVAVDALAPVAFSALEVYNNSNSGFGNFAVSLTGTTFTFTSLNGNDNIGQADYALAGLRLAPIPLPAGLLLLGGALGALGISRRRKIS